LDSRAGAGTGAGGIPARDGSSCLVGDAGRAGTAGRSGRGNGIARLTPIEARRARVVAKVLSGAIGAIGAADRAVDAPAPDAVGAALGRTRARSRRTTHIPIDRSTTAGTCQPRPLRVPNRATIATRPTTTNAPARSSMIGRSLS
jgi:hypothetical protein